MCFKRDETLNPHELDYYLGMKTIIQMNVYEYLLVLLLLFFALGLLPC